MNQELFEAIMTRARERIDTRPLLDNLSIRMALRALADAVDLLGREACLTEKSSLS